MTFIEVYFKTSLITMGEVILSRMTLFEGLEGKMLSFLGRDSGRFGGNGTIETRYSTLWTGRAPQLRKLYSGAGMIFSAKILKERRL